MCNRFISRNYIIPFLGVFFFGVMVPDVASAASLFVDDVAGFSTASAGLTYEGTEDFEYNILADNHLAFLDDPLTSGVPNDVFWAGLTAGLGLTVQSNTLGGAAITASPRGNDGLT